MSLLHDHDVIIHYSSMPWIDGLKEDHDYLTTLSSARHTCEVVQDGVECQRLADTTFTTSEGIERHVCDDCFRTILRWIMFRYYMRTGYDVLFFGLLDEEASA